MMSRILLLLTMVLALGSCKNVFDTQPLDRLIEDDVWRNQELMELNITSLYARFPWGYFPQGLFAAAAGERWGNTPNPTITNDAGGYWDYNYIRDLNVFLTEVETANVSEAVRNRMKGEVKVMRAVVYFEKQRRYGGVPLVDVVLDPFAPAGLDERYLRRATEEEIADFVDRELAEAIALLPDDHTRTGGINRWTAHAYKARANLLSASVARFPAPTAGQSNLIGIPAGRANEFYQKAAAAADAVINSGRFSLYTGHLPDRTANYRHVFLVDGNSEVIFERLYDGADLQHNYTTSNIFHYAVSGFGTPNTASYDPLLLGWENLDGSLTEPALGPDHRYRDGIEPWENKDPRFHVMVFLQGESYSVLGPLHLWEGIDPSPAGTANPDAILSDPNTRYPDASGRVMSGLHGRLGPPGPNRTLSGLVQKKYIEDAPFGVLWHHFESNSWKVIRLAEMYLTKAEAEFELGNLGAAAQALNMTRERAGLLPIEQVGGITRDRVRTERLSELAFETHRYWDFRRWRIAHERLDGLRVCGLRTIYHHAEDAYYFLPSTTTGEGCEGDTRQFLLEHYYNPMTNARLANNPHLEENPGY